MFFINHIKLETLNKFYKYYFNPNAYNRENNSENRFTF